MADGSFDRLRLKITHASHSSSMLQAPSAAPQAQLSSTADDQPRMRLAGCTPPPSCCMVSRKIRLTGERGLQKFLMQGGIPTETAARVYRRYLKLEPTHAEEYIAYLRSKAGLKAALLMNELGYAGSRLGQRQGDIGLSRTFTSSGERGSERIRSQGFQGNQMKAKGVQSLLKDLRACSATLCMLGEAVTPTGS